MGLDFPNLPYFVDTTGLKMTETYAIHAYLADKYCPELCGRTTEERANVDMLKGVLIDVMMKFTKPMYTGEKNADEISQMIFENAQKVIDF